ncbi:MAG: DUF2071 domain-containing protein [Cytophagales bacterium]|nr:DUF2071 domain-containing protein [Cytophagales bacterium]
MSFLTAEWRKLALANYVVDPKLLQPYVPNGTELDFWKESCYVSLVGFMFLNTRLFNIPIPFHRNFEEVNLRFYVRYKEEGAWKRGVVFIKEIVPKPALTFVANTVYKEHYQTLKMGHHWQEFKDLLEVEYSWEMRGKPNRLNVLSKSTPRNIKRGSEVEFITEHYWGYTKTGDKTYEYEVTHPTWQVYPVEKYEVEVDFGEVYGEQFAALSDMKPKSVMLAEGSLITVENKRKLS